MGGNDVSEQEGGREQVGGREVCARNKWALLVACTPQQCQGDEVCMPLCRTSSHTLLTPSGIPREMETLTPTLKPTVTLMLMERGLQTRTHLVTQQQRAIRHRTTGHRLHTPTQQWWPLPGSASLRVHPPPPVHKPALNKPSHGPRRTWGGREGSTGGCRGGGCGTGAARGSG